MQTQEVVFFRHDEALKTQKYVADNELLHFLKLEKITQLFSTFGVNYDSPRRVKKVQVFPSIKTSTQKLAMIHFHQGKYSSLERA